jgi:predicted hydrocarbon binding protein
MMDIRQKRLVKKSFSFRFKTFSEMESALELIFSPSAASVILYMSAIKCGTHLCRRIKKETRTKEEALSRLSELKNEEKRGKPSFQDVNFENGSGRLVIIDSFETVAHKSPGINQPCCHFFRGFLAGFLSELFRKTIEVIKEKCAGRGDEHCEFVFR